MFVQHNWQTIYQKQSRDKAKSPKKNSEKAWVNRIDPYSRGFKHSSIKKSFLEDVRYMRWYTYDSRSYLMRRIYPVKPFSKSKHHAKWPRNTP